MYMQQDLLNLDYTGNTANRICKYVVAHCNDERMLSEIHNDLKREFEDYSQVYKDVKTILDGFVSSKSKGTNILGATTRQQINNELLKLYSDGNRVKEMIKTLQPLIKELPGK